MQGLRKCMSFPEFRSLLSFESDLSLPIDGHERLADVPRAVFFGPDENDVVLDLFFSSAGVLYELVRLGRQDVLDSMRVSEESLLDGFLNVLGQVAEMCDIQCMKHCFLQQGQSEGASNLSYTIKTRSPFQFELPDGNSKAVAKSHRFETGNTAGCV